MESLGADEYQCFTCNRMFGNPVFNITREWERTHFGEGMPSVEILDSYGLECYCSRACVDARRDVVMRDEGVPIRRPGIGPIESCAICGRPVDMTESHRSYVESEEIAVNSLILKPVNVDYLAVVCRQCQPMKSMNSALQTEGCIDSPGAQE